MLIIPTDYKSIFKDRVLIITGVARSGTSILGKLIGSMSPVHYLFEPTILKWFGIIDAIDVNTIRATILEDYFLPLIQGRSLNFNPHDDSYIYNYKTRKEIILAMKNLNTRDKALEYINEIKPLFVIKMPDFQPYMETAKQIFPGLRALNIIRNGNDVVNSMVRRGWYTDEYMRNGITEWVVDSRITDGYHPWWIDEESKVYWHKWSQITRCACVWRCLIDYEWPIVPMNIFYESIGILDSANRFSAQYGLKMTELTYQHTDSIKEHKQKQYPDIIDKIEQPERHKFKRIMTQYDYAC